MISVPPLVNYSTMQGQNLVSLFAPRLYFPAFLQCHMAVLLVEGNRIKNFYFLLIKSS